MKNNGEWSPFPGAQPSSAPSTPARLLSVRWCSPEPVAQRASLLPAACETQAALDSPNLFKLILVIPSSLQMIGSVGTPWPIRTIFPGQVVVEQREPIQSDWTKGFTPWFRWKRFSPSTGRSGKCAAVVAARGLFSTVKDAWRQSLHTKEANQENYREMVPEPWLYFTQSPRDLWISCCMR